jgi:hypothetical protein
MSAGKIRHRELLTMHNDFTIVMTIIALSAAVSATKMNQRRFELFTL